MDGGRCTAHSIKEDFLKAVIVENLKKIVDRKVNKEKLSTESMDNFIKTDNYVDKLKNINDELLKLDSKFQKLYEDKLNGEISERNFKNVKEVIERKQELLLTKKKLVRVWLGGMKKRRKNLDYIEVILIVF